MEFTVAERLTLLATLPVQGDITTLKIVRQLREDLSFNEDEHTALGLKIEGDKISWNTQNQELKDVKVGDKSRDVIKASLENQSKRGTMTFAALALYERFEDLK